MLTAMQKAAGSPVVHFFVALSLCLSLAVYCSSWTFYGAVGSATESPWSHAPIYLGPIFLYVFAWPVIRRLLAVGARHRVTSIADYIGARYGKWQLGQDDFRFMFNYGSALGRYLGLNTYNDGFIDVDGDTDTIDQWGAFAAYQHYWTPQWRSTFSVSASGADNPSSTEYVSAENLAKSYQSVHANLNWLPAPRLQMGGELIYGYKEMEDGREGSLSRLQFAVKYAL